MDYDIIIIGGGPAGLSFARSLADSDLQVLIVERAPESVLEDPSIDGRDIALTHMSRRILENLGVWRTIPEEYISPIAEARVLDGESSYYLQFDQTANRGEPLGYLVSNHIIRRYLYNGIDQFDNIEIITERSVVGIEIATDGAAVLLDNEQKLTASLLVAADSRFSKVRGMAGIGADIRDCGQMITVCRMRHEKDHHQTAYECFLYGGTLAILPLNNHTSSIVLTAPADKMPGLIELQDKRFNEEIGRRFKHRLGAMALTGNKHSYPLFITQADDYARHRIALIGDAAVGMHPVTAHGFNLGLRGQRTLADIVLKAHRASSDIGLLAHLRHYHSRHKKSVLPIYLATNNIVKLFTSESLPARMVRKAALHISSDFKPFRNTISKQLQQKN